MKQWKTEQIVRETRIESRNLYIKLTISNSIGIRIELGKNQESKKYYSSEEAGC